MRKEKTITKPEKKFLREIFVAILLVLSVFILFSPTLRFGTVYYDDSDYVGVDNPHVPNGLTRDGIIWAFTTGHAANWHPVTWLSHMLDVELFGPGPGTQHFTNVLFHALNSLLVFLVLKKITGAMWRSAFVAALFALHPLHVESVAWISERKDVLSTFFWMLTIWAYAEYVRRAGEIGRTGEKPNDPNSVAYSPAHSLSHIRFYFLALSFFTLGLMSKPMVVTLPFVLLLLDIWPLQRIKFVRPFKLSPNRNLVLNPVLLEKIPLLILTVISCVITFWVQHKDGAVSSLAALSISARIENAFISYVRYIGKMFWPIDLAPLYPRPAEWPLWQVVGAIAFLLGISVLAVRALRRQPHFFVGWFWFLGTLVPVIGFVQVGSQAMADRYTYIPLIGLFIIVAWAAAEFFVRWRANKTAIGLFAICVLVTCAVLTNKQIGHWKDTETLMGHVLKVTGNNYLAQNILGLFYSDTGRYEEAISLYKKSLEIHPTFIDAHNNLGFALAQTGQHQEAIKHLRTALQIKPDYSEAHNNLGISLAAMGDIDEAISHYEIALAKNPKFAEAHNNLAIAFVMRGDYALGIENFRTACALKPDYLSALNALAWMLATHPNSEFRDGTEAVRLATRAVELTKENDAGVLETLAAAHAELGDFSRAANFARSALNFSQGKADHEMAARLEIQIKMYAANQPYRDADMNQN